MPIKLPTKQQCKGLRFGQFILNILDCAYYETALNKLYYIENKDLEKLINQYLKEYDQPNTRVNKKAR